jgi:hypothetical protein
MKAELFAIYLLKGLKELGLERRFLGGSANSLNANGFNSMAA